VHRFDTFVVRDDCVIDLNALQRHPNVQHVLRMPRGWVVYEFHHELFRDPDFLIEGVWREKMERFPELRQARIEMLQQEQVLLAPWYAKQKRRGNADGILASSDCTYYVFSLSHMRWVDFLPDEGWGSAREFTVSLTAESDGVPDVASRLAQEWLACGKNAGELEPVGDPARTGHTLVLRTQSSAFSGHWLAALWALFSDARWKMDLQRMRITVDNDCLSGDGC
jgi:hypothetical protein